MSEKNTSLKNKRYQPIRSIEEQTPLSSSETSETGVDVQQNNKSRNLNNNSNINNVGNGNENNENIGLQTKKKISISNDNKEYIQTFQAKSDKYEADLAKLTSNYKKIVTMIKTFKSLVEQIKPNKSNNKILTNNKSIKNFTGEQNITNNIFKSYIVGIYNDLYTKNSEYNVNIKSLQKFLPNIDKLVVDINNSLTKLSKKQSELKANIVSNNENTSNYAEKVLPEIKQLIKDIKTTSGNTLQLQGLYNNQITNLNTYWQSSIVSYKQLLVSKINAYYTRLIMERQTNTVLNNLEGKSKKEKIELLIKFKSNINKISNYISILQELFTSLNSRKTYFSNNYDDVNAIFLENLNSTITKKLSEITALSNNLDEKIRDFKTTTDEEIQSLFSEMTINYKELIDTLTNFFAKLNSNLNILKTNKNTSTALESNIKLSNEQKQVLPQLESLYTNFKYLSSQYNNRVPSELLELLQSQISSITSKLSNILSKNNLNYVNTNGKKSLQGNNKLVYTPGNMTGNKNNNTKTTGSNIKYPGLLNNSNLSNMFQIGDIVTGENSNGKNITGTYSEYVPENGLRGIVNPNNGRTIVVPESSIRKESSDSGVKNRNGVLLKPGNRVTKKTNSGKSTRYGTLKYNNANKKYKVEFNNSPGNNENYSSSRITKVKNNIM